jgi:hypothetical protein
VQVQAGERAAAARSAGGTVRLVTAVVAVVLVACTGSSTPAPSPTPTPDETTEPAPSGVQVAVVMPPPEDPASGAFLDADAELAELEGERVGDVASVRAVVPDAGAFVADLAALLADQGADLVCVLGADGPRTVLDLADRFPATRFCATAAPRDGQPRNVDLFDVDHEALGHVLGASAAAAVGDGAVGLVRGDDSDDAARRREGARAALVDTAVVVDAIVRDEAETAALVDAIDDADLDLVVVDAADAAVATALAATAPRWAGPRGVAIDASAGAALVRWSLRIDVIVGLAIDRLVGNAETGLPPPLGFAEEAFTITFADDVPEEVRAATDAVADELARGVRDPLGGMPTPGDGPPEDADG